MSIQAFLRTLLPLTVAAAASAAAASTRKETL